MALRIFDLHRPKDTKKTAPDVSIVIEVARRLWCGLMLNCGAAAVKKVSKMESMKKRRFIKMATG